MDRTASNRMLSTTMCSSSIANPKLEEKHLSENIYQALHILCSYNKPSADFLAVFTKDMFIKVNTKAFPHIVQFLFYTLDADEFKKRFFWPNFDKSSEAVFRTSAINYLNYLNQKHKLGFEILKSHIAVIPGGVKFMKVIYELCVLVMRETIKKKMINKQDELLIQQSKISLKNQIILLKRQLSDVKEYKKKLEESTTECLARTNEIKLMLDKVFKPFNVKHEKLLYEHRFLKACEQHINVMIHIKIEPYFNQIKQINEHCDLLRKSCLHIFDEKRDVIEYDKDRLKQCQQIWRRHYHQQEHREMYLIEENNKINFSNLFYTFEHFLPLIIEKCQNVKFKSAEQLDNESTRLDRIENRVSTIYVGITNYEKRLNDRMFKCCLSPSNSPVNSNLINKIMYTPRTLNGNVSVAKLLPRFTVLMDDNQPNQGFLRPENRQISHNNQLNVSTTLLNTSIHNKSIQSTTKKLPKSNDILKEITQRFKKINFNEQTDRTPAVLSSTILASPNGRAGSSGVHPINFSYSSSSPLYENKDKIGNRIFSKQIIETTAAVSPDGIIYQKRCTNSIIHLNSPSDMNTWQAVNRSPSGRFINYDENVSIPKFVLNDENEEPNIMKTTATQPSRSIMATPTTIMYNRCSKGNIDSSHDCQRKVLFSPGTEAAESLFNISDAIINNTPM